MKAFVACLFLVLLCPLAKADAQKPILIIIKNHHFTPAEIHVPSGKEAIFIVKNLDSTVEEFESLALNIESVVEAKSEIKITLPPTEHGHYTFVGDYNDKIARGVIIVD